jgi:DNA-binding MarR family transcriptional regulator
MHTDFFKTELKDIAELDQVIHTPARLMVIMLLNASGTLDFIRLMGLTNLTWGNLSTHLSKLEEAGYVMITKTFKGKRPHTLISLTDTGRQAYLQWGRTIIKALPQSVQPGYLYESTELYPDIQQIPQYLIRKEFPLTGSRDVFFLPRYHRWGMELPPIREMNPLS